MRPLDDRKRRRLLTLSAMLCAAALMLAPLAGRTSFEIAGEYEAFNARFANLQPPQARNDHPVAITRDPFASARTQAAARPAMHGQTAGIASVRAVVTGTSARALVEINGVTRVVACGDMLVGSRVIAIDAAGVRLQNGTVLPLTGDMP